MSNLIHVNPDAVEQHGKAVQSIVSGEVDGAAAGLQELGTMAHVFGLICSPILDVPVEALGTAAEAMMSSLSSTGTAIEGGLAATAALYQAVDASNASLFGGTGGS